MWHVGSFNPRTRARSNPYIPPTTCHLPLLCPIQIDTSTPSCGNSRFGCWTCTVVDRDKASEGLLASGDKRMEGLFSLLARCTISIGDQGDFYHRPASNSKVALALWM